MSRRRRSRLSHRALSFAALVAACVGAACGPGGVPRGGQGDDAGAGAADLSPVVGPGGEPVTASAQIGPIDLSPGFEITLCRHVALDLDQPMFVTRIEADLAPGSHHLILYKSERDAVDLAPSPCGPFEKTFSRDERPLMIVEKAHDDLRFPEGVGLFLKARQVVKFEAHYINATAATIQGIGAVRLSGITVGTATAGMQRANLGFWGTTGIRVPPHGTFDTGVRFQRGYRGTGVFALTTHQHRYGTRMRVWRSPARGHLDGEPIADTTHWAEPPLYRVDPPYVFDGRSGLSFQCEWSNPTDDELRYGESALQEMCFLWLYYYPSAGFDFCVDGTCFTAPEG